MSTPPASLSPVSPESSPGQRQPSWQRILGTFYAPDATFTDIAREPHYMLCLGLEIVIGTVATWFIVRRIGSLHIALRAIQQSPAAQSLSSQQIHAQAAISAKFIHFSPFFVIFGTPLAALIVAACMLGAANFGLGLQAKFKQMFSLTTHALLPLSIAYLLALPIVFTASHPGQLDSQNLVGSNLGFFLSSTSPHWLQVFGARIDIFSFWVIGLLALGISKTGPRVKYGSALTAVVLLWLVYVLAVTGIAAI